MRWLSTLSEIRAKKLTLARLDPRAGMPILPPPGASPRAIAAVEQRLGLALPPSYKELLACHDGVPQLYQGASLLGTQKLARGTYVDLARMIIDAPEGGDIDRDALVPFGIDAEAETIFAWDTAHRRADGELEVIVWVNDIGVRLDDFPSLLELCADMLASDVAERMESDPTSRRRTHQAAEMGYRAA